MKKFFLILGGVFAAILVIGGIAAVILIPQALRLNRDATAYIQDNVPKIVVNWNVQELFNRGTPQLISMITTHGGAERLFSMFSRLGKFKHLDEPKGSVGFSAFTGADTAILGNYTATAQFENGDATIRIQLRRFNNSWQINGFFINSDVFLQPVSGKTPQPGKRPH